MCVYCAVSTQYHQRMDTFNEKYANLKGSRSFELEMFKARTPSFNCNYRHQAIQTGKKFNKHTQQGTVGVFKVKGK